MERPSLQWSPYWLACWVWVLITNFLTNLSVLLKDLKTEACFFFSCHCLPSGFRDSKWTWSHPRFTSSFLTRVPVSRGIPYSVSEVAPVYSRQAGRGQWKPALSHRHLPSSQGKTPLHVRGNLAEWALVLQDTIRKDLHETWRIFYCKVFGRGNTVVLITP